jgi:hypothetical protein
MFNLGELVDGTGKLRTAGRSRELWLVTKRLMHLEGCVDAHMCNHHDSQDVPRLSVHSGGDDLRVNCCTPGECLGITQCA